MSENKPVTTAPSEAAVSFDVGAPDALDRLAELFALHGDIYRMYVPARRCYTYVIHHPDDVKHVLVSNHRNYTKGVDRDRIRILLGRGLMTSEGEYWTRHHDMMQPMFHRRIIARFVDIMSVANDEFLADLHSQTSHGGHVNITEAMSELTLRIVLGVIFGVDSHETIDGFSVVARDTARNLAFVYKFRALATLVAKIIRQRQTNHRSDGDYLGLLLHARDKTNQTPMTEREVIDEIMTLVVAGHETTASVLNWTWYLLALHPDVEHRLRAELETSGDRGEQDLAKLDSLTYTRQVLNEVMRLYPPGWLLSRRTIGPDVLRGCEIAAGSNVLIPLYLLHRHPRYWTDPDRFDPDRFASEREAQRPRYAYLPFSAGPRHCIGETLAMYEMLMHLYKVVPRYQLRLVDQQPVEIEAQINLRARNPFIMAVEQCSNNP